MNINDVYLEKNEIECFDRIVAAAISGYTATGMSTKTLEQHAAGDAVGLAYQVIELRRRILQNRPYVESTDQ